MVSGGAAQASNAYPFSRVADAVAGYVTAVAGSAAAGVIVKAAKAAASMIAATPMRQRFNMLTSLTGLPTALQQADEPYVNQCWASAAPMFRDEPIDAQLV